MALWKEAISFVLVNISVGLYYAENRNSFDLDLSLGQAARRGRDFTGLGRRHERCS